MAERGGKVEGSASARRDGVWELDVQQARVLAGGKSLHDCVVRWRRGAYGVVGGIK